MIDNSIVDQKIEQIKSAFAKIDPHNQLIVDDNGDGSKLVYGPFPSFIILVQTIGSARALIHVNADAPNMVLIFQELFKVGVEFDGPFAVKDQSGELVLNEAAYSKKEDNILMFAQDILNRRAASDKRQSTLLMPEKKIVLA